jgi:hypothetical protein
MASRIWLYYAGAGATFIAGVLHLTLVPNVIDRNMGTGMPITGRGGSISNIGFATELFQVIYIIVNLIIVLKDRNINRKRDVINSVDE